MVAAMTLTPDWGRKTKKPAVRWLEDSIAESLSVGCEADYDEGPAFDEWRFEREAA